MNEFMQRLHDAIVKRAQEEGVAPQVIGELMVQTYQQEKLRSQMRAAVGVAIFSSGAACCACSTLLYVLGTK